MVSYLTRDVLLEHLNSKFQLVVDESTRYEMELVSVSDALSYPGQTGFSIVFLAPDAAPAVQQIYHLEHEVLGGSQLFLVPIKRDAKGLYYEAVFNRLVREGE